MLELTDGGEGALAASKGGADVSVALLSTVEGCSGVTTAVGWGAKEVVVAAADYSALGA